MKNSVILTEGILNNVVKSLYGEEAVVTFLEELEMDAIVIYKGEKIKRIIELEDALPAIGQAFNQDFLAYEITELEELGTGYVFFLPMNLTYRNLSNVSCA